MQATVARAAPTMPPLEALVLDPADVPEFKRVFLDRERASNEALADRAEEPERHRRRLHRWGRIDGLATRLTPARPLLPTHPIVVDSSAARFETCAGAMQALTDESAFPDEPSARRLFPRNIAENTECLHLVFEDDGERYSLYRVDFRVGNLLGSVGVVWRYPHGGPMQALRLAEKQAFRMRTASNLPAARTSVSASRAGVQVLSPEREERQLPLVREA